MRQRRGVRGWCVLVALAGAVGACETARNPGGVLVDRISPTIGQTDTIFNTTVTSFTKSTIITFPANSGSGGSITITGRATDGAGNFTQATTVVFLSNVQALTVDLLAPTAPAVASTGKNILVQVHAQQLGGLARIGFIVVPRNAVVDPTTPPTDSLVFTPPARQPPDTFYTDTLTVQAGFTTFTVTGFGVDTALAAVPPFTVTPLKFVVDSTMAAANLTTVDKVFALGLPLSDSGLPKSVVIRGYACDLAVARNCAYSQTSTVIAGSAPRPAALMAIGASSGVDTVIVVAGTTHSLPFGGHIADAIYNSNRRELYLTNDVLGRVEVYNLATNTFDPNGIITAGPVPWGIALWPVDTLGTYDPNRVVVADAGGTELSILDASTRRLLWRQGL